MNEPELMSHIIRLSYTCYGRIFDLKTLAVGRQKVFDEI